MFGASLSASERKGSRLERLNVVEMDSGQLYIPSKGLEALESRWWRWKHDSKIHYYTAGREGESRCDSVSHVFQSPPRTIHRNLHNSQAPRSARCSSADKDSGKLPNNTGEGRGSRASSHPCGGFVEVWGGGGGESRRMIRLARTAKSRFVGASGLVGERVNRAP